MGILASSSCRIGDVDDNVPTLERLVPIAVSSPEAWALFDRSLSTGFDHPSKSVVAMFEGTRELAAFKVKGASPYRLQLFGPGHQPLSAESVDVSSLSSGWHTFPLSDVSTLPFVELEFTPNGDGGTVPEIELWGLSDSDQPNAGLVTSVALTSSAEIEPAHCTSFQVALTYPPEQFRTARLEYTVVGALRGFALDRTINGVAAQGGAWVGGDDTPHIVSELIDPAVLAKSKNEVAFCVPAEAERNVVVKGVELVAELDRGTHLVSRASAGEHEFDLTKWKDSDAATSDVVPARSALSVEFDRLIAPDVVVLDAVAPTPSSIECRDRSGVGSAVSFSEHRSSSSLNLILNESRTCATLSMFFDGDARVATLDVVGSGAAERVDWPRVVVSSAPEQFGDVAYVGGFVVRPRQMTTAIRVAVADQADASRSGDFGQLLHRATSASEQWSVPLKVSFPDGTISLQSVLLASDRSVERAGVSGSSSSNTSLATQAARFGREGEMKLVSATPSELTKIRLGSAVGVDVSPGAVPKATDVSVRQMKDLEVPALDDGMINVTGPKGHGYEFLPHHQRFARDVEVVLPYEPSLIPEGMTVDDVHTYFFDEDAGKWVRLPRAAIDVGQRTMRSTTNHFTIMINAVIAVPKNPTPLSFDPTALGAIAAASPTANVALIPEPTANSSGDARTALPLKLPGGRGAFSPSLAIGYSSSSGNGWLGVGWDLTSPKIEVDTRWGTPRFSPDQDRYLLNGAALVPTTDTDGPRCENGTPGLRYHERIEGAFDHILRCLSPNGVPYFEVRDRNGTLFVYGDDETTSSHASLASPQDPAFVYRWNLQRVVDVDGNTTVYGYGIDELPTAEVSRESYLTRIAYTSHPAGPAAAYTVELIQDAGSRPDVIVSGRPGFKMVTRHLLRRVRVSFAGSAIREYVLSYRKGQFSKTVLTSIREYGVGGCSASLDAFTLPSCSGEFHEHRFDYLRDEEGFGPVEQKYIDVADDFQRDALIQKHLFEGVGTTTSAGVGVSALSGTKDVGSVGVGGNMGSRRETAGTYDLNGDGLVDQVYLQPHLVRALYNKIQPGDLPPNVFEEKNDLNIGLDSMGQESRVGVRAQAHLSGGGASVGVAGSLNLVYSRRLLLDADGDGYLDLLNGSQVLLGRPNGNELRWDPVPFRAVDSVDPNRDPIMSGLSDAAGREQIMGDAVTSWTAPYSGRVTIHGSARKPSVSQDGVELELFHQDSPLQDLVVDGTNVADLVFPATQTLDVAVGDILSLRVKTGFDDGLTFGGELQDQVEARLFVAYEEACAPMCSPIADPTAVRDPSGAPLYSFDSASDFRLAGGGAYALATSDGTLALHARLAKAVTTSDLRACVQRFPAVTPGFSPQLDAPCDVAGTDATNVSGTAHLAAGAATAVDFDQDIDVSVGEIVVLRVESDFSYDPASVSLTPTVVDTPTLAYTAVCDPDDNGSTICSADPTDLATVSLPLTHFGPWIALAPPPDFPVVAVADETWTFDAVPNLDGFLFAVRSDRHGLIEQIDCRQSSCPLTFLTPLSVVTGESVSFEAVGGSSPASINVVAHRSSGSPITSAANVFAEVRPPQSPSPFIGGYRGWKATVWNEAEPFTPSQLTAEYASISTLDTADRERVVRSAIRPVATFPPESPYPTLAWAAPNSAAFVSAGSLNSGRIGAIAEGTSLEDAGAALDTHGYVRASGTQGLDFSLSVGSQGLFNLGLDLNVGKSWTKTSTDVVDLNGDGVVDILSGDHTLLGRLLDSGEGSTSVPGFGSVDGFRKRTSFNYGLGLNGGVSFPQTDASGNVLVQLPEHASGPLGFSHGSGFAIGRSEVTNDLFDINGDGLPDLVSRDGRDINVQYNLGNRFGAPEKYGELEMLDAVDGFQALEGQEILLDSTSDALVHDTTITQRTTNSTNFIVYSSSKSTTRSSTRTTRQVLDINGDGLPDLVLKRDQDVNIKVQFNLGKGFSAPVDWPTTSWDGLSLGTDFSGGNNLSLIPSALGVTGRDVLGIATTPSISTTSHSLKLPISEDLAIDLDYSKASDADAVNLALIDLNGDGAPEHVLRRSGEESGSAPGSVAIYVKPNLATGRANLLARVERPLGGSFAMTYERTANTVDDPHSRFKLTRVEDDDGVDLGSGYESPNGLTRFFYEDPFFDRYEKEFYGYGTVTTRRSDGVTVADIFENRTYPLHGRLLSETRRDLAGKLFRQSSSTYTTLAVRGPGDVVLAADTTCVGNLHTLLGHDACLAVLPVVTDTVETVAEGGIESKTHRAHDGPFDRFGNALASLDEADDSTTSDDLYASVEFKDDLVQWILSRPISISVRAGSAGGPLLRSRSATYEVAGHISTVSVDTGTGTATTNLGYDAYGNLNHVVTPSNESGLPQVYDVVFEDTTHTFPQRISNAFGLASSAAYDLRFGLPSVEIDANGVQRTQTYDAFGRLATVRGPYDTSAPAIELTYFPNGSPPRAISINRASAPSDYSGPIPTPITTVAIADGAGRAIEVRKTATVNGVVGMTTSGLARYDALGHTVASYYPFFTAGASTAFATPTPTLATTMEYDAMDRAIRVQHPDGAAEHTSYAVVSPPDNGPLLLRNQISDANGHLTESYTDVVGRMRAYVEHPSASTSSITTYGYSPTGELSTIVDAEGSTTQLAYDRRGLRTSFTNPDTGLITDRYDLMGNHVGLTEPNHRAVGAEVTFRYDRDRLVKVDYPSKPDVMYSYGAPGAADFRAGRITQVSDETGSQQHYYGALGEVRRTTRTVVDPAHPSQAAKLFDFRFTVDSFGRQLRIQYPDGEQVTDSYDAGGSLVAIVGAGTSWTKTYADSFRYDVFGNQTRVRFGNNVVQDWTYDPTRIRLASTVTTLPSATKVQDLHYGYDLVGNPTSIENTLPPPPTNGKLPGTSGGTFTYDGVDRLVHAGGHGLMASNKSTTYDLSFAYSPSHNIVTKTLVHDVITSGGNHTQPNETNYGAAYSYAQRPHLPSRVGDSDYTYDPSGNLTRRQQVGAGSAQTYTWDDDGRMVQVSGQGANQRNVFDAAGLRVLRDGQGGTKIFASPLYDLEGSNQGQKHIFAGAMRIASVSKSYVSTSTPSLPTQAGTAFFFHADHLGSTGAVTKDDGTLNDAHDYFPDGEAWIDSGPKDSVNGYLFNGKPFDTETGFYDFGQRFYDPKTSLWLGEDPALVDSTSSVVGSPVRGSGAAFSGHNPLRFRDPNGRDFFWEHARDGKPVVEFVPERYGPNAGGGVPLVVEGRAGAKRKEAEDIAELGTWDRPTAFGYVADNLIASAPRILEGAFATEFPYVAGLFALTQAKNHDETVMPIMMVAGGASPFPRASAVSAEGALTRVYRVEGSVNQRLVIDSAGNVSVQGRKMLFLNFGDAARAEQFLATRVAQGMEGVTVKSFQVPTSFVDELAASAVPESMARQFPNSPLAVDVTRAANQFGLRPAQIEALERAIVPGSAR
ncbi:MAG TPA: SpvB/TcaC N-terminal domain-containing protein [Kofleriaceae bacterium]